MYNVGDIVYSTIPESGKIVPLQIIEISIVAFFLILGLTIMAAFVLLLMHSQGKL